jgi:carbon-monoxide dehydrogenase large subunit
LAAPGVQAVFTGADMAEDKVGTMKPLWQITSKDGTAMAEPPRWALARSIVRHVGEPVAVVIADTINQAADAAEAVMIEYSARTAETSATAALLPEAPQLHEVAVNNTCFQWERGDGPAVDQALAKADKVIKLDLTNNRLVGGAIETRGVVGLLGPMTDGLVLYSTTQAPHHIRLCVAEQLNIRESDLRVISPNVGGGFGIKGKHYPEETIVAWATQKLRRTVKWIGRREESFISDTQGRDHQTHAELALSNDGEFLGLKVKTVANIGAYISTFGANIPSAIYSALLSGVYQTPAVHVEVTGVFTNTVPVDAYRGAGRPEACYVLERLADQAAKELKRDRVEIRLQNMITVEEMPYPTAIGPTYDSGNFPALLQKACKNADYENFEERRQKSHDQRKLRGIGVASFVESSGIAPSRMAGALGARVATYESAHIRVNEDGSITAMLGTHSHGQGHVTTFAQILSEQLGVTIESIDVLEGDTALVPRGTGTFGSRSVAVGGSALVQAANKIINKGQLIAAHLLEAAISDIEFTDGIFRVSGTDRKISFKEVAKAANAPFKLPQEIDPGLDENAFYDPTNFAFSNGAHIAEVEIDPDTGAIKLLDYVAVDDIGTVINPMIVEGQIQGGLAQGIGQVLMENCAYDPQTGQLLTGSFLDYAMPRADNMPNINSELDQSQPCTHNPLGAKGCGESGAIGAPSAIASAVLDALHPLGVTDIQMPLTSETVWQAIRQSSKN